MLFRFLLHARRAAEQFFFSLLQLSLDDLQGACQVLLALYCLYMLLSNALHPGLQVLRVPPQSVQLLFSREQIICTLFRLGLEPLQLASCFRLRICIMEIFAEARVLPEHVLKRFLEGTQLFCGFLNFGVQRVT